MTETLSLEEDIIEVTLTTDNLTVGLLDNEPIDVAVANTADCYGIKNNTITEFYIYTNGYIYEGTI